MCPRQRRNGRVGYGGVYRRCDGGRAVDPAEAVLRFVCVVALETVAGVGPPPASVKAAYHHLKEGARVDEIHLTTPLSWSSGDGASDCSTIVDPRFVSLSLSSLMPSI